MSSVEIVLSKLFSSFPNTAITEATVLVYVEHLQDVPADMLETIVGQCIEECRFLPTIAEIKERQYALTGGLNETTAAEAWGSVELAIRRVTRYGTPKFKDPLTARVVSMMGWRNLCDSESPAGVDRAQFMRMYGELADRQRKIDRLTPAARILLESHTPDRKLIEFNGLSLPEVKQ